jgi:hypothetical protein
MVCFTCRSQLPLYASRQLPCCFGNSRPYFMSCYDRACLSSKRSKPVNLPICHTTSSRIHKSIKPHGDIQAWKSTEDGRADGTRRWMWYVTKAVITCRTKALAHSPQACCYGKVSYPVRLHLKHINNPTGRFFLTSSSFTLFRFEKMATGQKHGVRTLSSVKTERRLFDVWKQDFVPSTTLLYSSE